MRSSLYRRTYMALCAVRRNRSGPLRFLFCVSGRIRSGKRDRREWGQAEDAAAKPGPTDRNRGQEQGTGTAGIYGGNPEFRTDDAGKAGSLGCKREKKGELLPENNKKRTEEGRKRMDKG